MTKSSNDKSSVTLEIARSPGAGGATRFTVPVSGPARVLDALMHIRRHADPTLGFRYACRVGMCGSCAVVVNGKEVLACQASVHSFEGDVLKVEPLKGLPRQRDLMVDMTPFFNALRSAEAAFKPMHPDRRDVPVIAPDAGERPSIERQNGCITCGACHSAAQPRTGEPPVLGPAPLNRVLMLALDERDAKGRGRLEAAGRDRRFLEEGDLAALENVCPVEIPLATGLRRLRSLVAETSAGN